MKASGVKEMKSLRFSNAINLVRATISGGLEQLRSLDSVAAMRGKSKSEILS